MEKDRGYQIYCEVRDEFTKIIDKFGVNVVVHAMTDELVTITEGDAVELVKESLKSHLKIIKEGKNGK